MLRQFIPPCKNGNKNVCVYSDGGDLNSKFTLNREPPSSLDPINKAITSLREINSIYWRRVAGNRCGVGHDRGNGSAREETIAIISTVS